MWDWRILVVNIFRRAAIAPFALILAALLSVAPSARAGARVTCQILNVTPVNFGGYSSGGRAPMDSAGELEVSRSAQTSVRISFGPSATGRESPREMRAAGGSRAVPWRDGAQGTESQMALVPAGQTLRLPIFARVFGAQAIPPGNYRDRLVVTLFF
jgi:spore coat protein U-like protein